MKYYSSNSNLKKHKKSIHDLSFLTKNHYFLLEAIKELNVYKCPNCNQQFKDRSNYHKHMKTHENIYYECSKCDKFYKCKQNLNQHFKTHDKPYLATCSKCNKVLATNTSLKKHMKKMHQIIKFDHFCCTCLHFFHTQILFKVLHFTFPSEY